MEEVFQKILEIGITAGFAVIGVCLVRLLCKKAPKWIVVALWGLVGLRLLLPFSIESPVSMIPEVSLPSISTPQSEQAPSKEQSELPQGDYTHGEGGTQEALGNAVTMPSAPAISEPSTPSVSVARVASTIWIFGVAAMMWYAAMTYIGVWRRVRTAVKDENGVYRSEAVGSPFILGVFRPRIYMPYAMEGDSLQAVLAHERTHIKRFDHIIKPLGFLLLSVYWFQPLLWVAYILLCRDIELACDERVVKTLGEDERREYSMALVTSAVGRRRIAACPLAFGEVAVKERVKSVMSYKKPAFWIVITAVVLSVVAAVCLLTDPVSGTPYTTLDGATLVFGGEIGQYDHLELPKGEDYIASVGFEEHGKVYFTLEETNNRKMSATLSMSKPLYRNGRKVSKVTAIYGETVTLNEKPDGTGKQVILSITLPSTATDNYWYSNEDSTTVTRYANGDTALYLYYKHFWLTTDGASATDLTGQVPYNWKKANDYETETTYRTEGSYEWVDDTLVLTEDGGLTRYVFKVGEDGSLTHLKGQLSRHKKAQSPVLANKLTLAKDYVLTVTKGEAGDCHYTLTDGQGKHSFEGESNLLSEPVIVSYADGVVRVVTEEPDGSYREQHELIDLVNGKSLGVCSYASSDYRTFGSGYVPMVCEKDGKVMVKAQYSSWCGTAPPPNFLYTLEGLTSLRSGIVCAVIDGDEIVISYTDDNGSSHVIAEMIGEDQNGEGVALDRPLVTVTEFDADGKPLSGSQMTQYFGKEGVLTYSEIAAAFVRVDGKYVDAAQAITAGTLTFERLEALLEQAVTDGTAKKTVYNEDENHYRIDILNADMYHEISVMRDAAGVYTVEIGNVLTLPPLSDGVW